MSRGDVHVAPHDAYFTIRETVGTSTALFPDAGVRWHYTPPPVFLGAWEPLALQPGAAYTTVTRHGIGLDVQAGGDQRERLPEHGEPLRFTSTSALPSTLTSSCSVIPCSSPFTPLR